jgi:hypothetical protein
MSLYFSNGEKLTEIEHMMKNVDKAMLKISAILDFFFGGVNQPKWVYIFKFVES